MRSFLGFNLRSIIQSCKHTNKYTHAYTCAYVFVSISKTSTWETIFTVMAPVYTIKISEQSFSFLKIQSFEAMYL